LPTSATSPPAASPVATPAAETSTAAVTPTHPTCTDRTGSGRPIDGKTVTRRLSQTEAELYQEWIANDRQLRAIITQMRQVAGKATELTMREAKKKSAKV
jgi:hypothetical protein